MVGWENSNEYDCTYYNEKPGYCVGVLYRDDGTTLRYDHIPESGITPVEACCICQEWDECEDDDDWVGNNDEGCEYYEKYPADCGRYDSEIDVTAFEACCSCSLVAE